LAHVAAKAAANLLKILSYGSIIPSTPQNESKAFYYEMPNAKQITINWKEMTAAQIHRLVNACNPWNKGASTSIASWIIAFTETELMGDSNKTDIAAGTILACNKEEGLLIQTCDAKKIKVTIVYLQEGFYSGWRLTEFGLKPNMQMDK
jgi:methionyl-tRNA formyltransferase